MSQRIVGMAAFGVPSPIRWVLETRLVANVVVYLVPLLITVGVLTLDWSNGWPRFNYNRERAAEIGDAGKKVAGDVRDKIPDSVVDKVRDSIPESLSLDKWKNELAAVADKLPVDLPNWATADNKEVPVARTTGPTIRIASFNIQVLGDSKGSKPEVMSVLAEVVQRFDVIAIQELRAQTTGVVDQLVSLANRDGRQYRYVAGQRLGRTSSKEQYVFVYDASRINLDPASVVTVPDPQDFLHREPTIARFQVRAEPGRTGFSFILANIHTDPDETDQELDALDDVFVSLQKNAWREDDVILLGDLNVDYKHLGQLGQLPNIAYTVRGEPTNTRGTKSYDNIVFDRIATTEFVGVAGVFNLQREFGLSMDAAIDVSDHLPVWAEFDAYETGSSIALAAASQPIKPLAPHATVGRARIVENPLRRLRGYPR